MKLKYYIIFINTLDGFKIVSINSYGSGEYEEYEADYFKFSSSLAQNGFDWIGGNQVEYHQIQLHHEVC